MRPTRQHLIELERLSAGSARDTGSELLARVVDLFLLTAERQGEAERAVFGQVMETLAYRLDTTARAALALRLVEAEAPAALVRRLAADDITVARPLLERSASLSEADLIAIAGSAGPEHLDAISRRRCLSRPVVDLLLSRADEAVCLRIADHTSLPLSRRAFELLAARAVAQPDLKAALVRRDDLPADLRARLQAPVRPRAAISPAAPDPPSADRPAADEAVLARAARSGHAGLTVDCFSVLTGLDRAAAEQCLLRNELSALVVLCKAHDFSATTFSALLQLRIDSGALSAEAAARAMRRYGAVRSDTAQRIMRLLRGRLGAGEPAA